MRAARRLRLTASVAALLLLLGCAPLYLPLVPEAPSVASAPRVKDARAELSGEGRPRVEVSLAGDIVPGWLAVQWFAPSGGEAASEAAWVSGAGESALFTLPGDVELKAGEWRAVLSFNGRVLRQFSFQLE